MNKLTIKSQDKKLKIEIQKRTLDNRTGHITLQFQIGPFKKGIASTLGSSLRRTLLSLSQTVAITSAFGNLYEGNSLREDLFELSLNLQKISIKSSFFPYMGVARIIKTGPCIVTAQDILFGEGLKAVNPYQYVCTLNESYKLDLFLVISSPTLNQTISQTNPLKPTDFIDHSTFKNQLNRINLSHFSKSRLNFESLTNPKPLETDPSENPLKIETITKQVSNRNLMSNSTEQNSDKSIIYKAQKLATDIIVVDPNYSLVQSCSFEVIQTTKSSVGEYEKLVEYGITDTDEFLQFVLITRGSIEPVDAVHFAAKQLTGDLAVFEALPHLFASENNLFLTLEKVASKTKLEKIRSNISSIYKKEIIKSFDIRHLNLPPKLELFLRRQGFINFENLLVTPLSFLKKIGLRSKEFEVINVALKKFGLKLGDSQNLQWDLIPLPLKSDI